MFACSIHKAPGGVAYVLCSTTRCYACDKINNIFGSAVEELLRVWWTYWEFMFKSCAFCKASGSNKGHMHDSNIWLDF